VSPTILIPRLGISQTIKVLQRSGQRRHEGIVFWLGRRAADRIEIVEVYEPAHEAKADFFHIPPHSMQDVQAELRSKRLMIAAQVHSHPMEAFHSQADDTWAVIRHVDAVSIVLPYFASRTSVNTFFSESAVFQLSSANCWLQVPDHGKDLVCRMSQ